MRTSVYIPVLAFVFAVLIAFATAPAMAQSMSDVEKSFSTPAQSGAAPSTSDPAAESRKKEMEQQRLKMETERGKTGEVSTGASEREKAQKEMKSGAKEAGKEFSAPARSGETGRLEMKGETGKSFTAPAESGDVKQELEKKPMKTESGRMGEMKREMGRTPGFHSEGKAGAVERGAVERGMTQPGVTERGAAKIEERGAMKIGESQVSGGVAVVARVDRPDNCLKIRSEASASSEVLGCVAKGESLNLTGVFSPDGRWAQLDNNGWVFFNQLKTDVMRPQAAAAGQVQTGKSYDKPARAAGKAPGKKSYYHGYSCGYFPGYSYYWGPGYYHRHGFGRRGAWFWGY